MSKKKAVSCPTGDEWNKVQEKARNEGWDWRSGHIPPTLRCKYIHFNEDWELMQGDIDDYTIISATDYLAYGLEGKPFKVGNEVEVVIKSGGMYPKGYTGKVSSLNDHDSNYCHINNRGACIPISHLKLIESEDSMKEERTAPLHPLEYSVPLRVDDRVRVVGNSRGYFESKDGHEGVIDCVTNTVRGDYYNVGNINLGFYAPDLELIPTEKDITVGSVWEFIPTKGLIREVVGFNEHGFLFKGLDIPWSSDHKHNFLRKHKLIHRGDEEMEEKDECILFTLGQQKKVQDLIDDAYKRAYRKALEGKPLETNEPKQTNKKEKKMKKLKLANKIIKVGDAVIDRECNNEGIVVAVYPESEQVSYRDYKNDEIETVNVRRLYQQFVSPKPKPEKPTKPKAKKKVVKKVSDK